MVLSNMTEFLYFVEHQHRFSKKTSLAKMSYLCELFGHPENSFRTIHVGGTNGKGSVVAYLYQVLTECGMHVGTYTSPYVECFNERIAYEGKFISDEDCLKYANLILEKFPQIDADGVEQPTFFEFITLMSYLYFRDRKDLDLAIMEVGLGGLLDATNVITPLLSVIVTVSYDHMNVLGDTLESIANNKLGIVKPGIPLVSGVCDPALRKQFSGHVKTKGTTVTFTDFDRIKVKKMDLSGSLFDYKGHKDIELRLLGRHQIENASLVIEAVEILNRNPLFHISEAALRKGLLTARWVGRAEVMHTDPLIIIDGGHNIDAITRMCEFVKYVKSLKNGAYVRGIFAVSADKAKDRMIPILDATFDELVFTEYNYKRSDDAENIFNISKHPNKSYCENVDAIIERVMKEPDVVNVFLGSLYFVSQVRPVLERYKNQSK